MWALFLPVSKLVCPTAVGRPAIYEPLVSLLHALPPFSTSPAVATARLRFHLPVRPPQRRHHTLPSAVARRPHLLFTTRPLGAVVPPLLQLVHCGQLNLPFLLVTTRPLGTIVFPFKQLVYYRQLYLLFFPSTTRSLGTVDSQLKQLAYYSQLYSHLSRLDRHISHIPNTISDSSSSDSRISQTSL